MSFFFDIFRFGDGWKLKSEVVEAESGREEMDFFFSRRGGKWGRGGYDQT